jgi:thioester reductase-like protein
MAILDAVPNLGTAYGLHEQPRRTDVCFNYLGSFTIPFDDDLQPELSRHQIGPVRGLDNDRVYGLKLTARIHDGQLVADLSFTPQRYKPELMLQIARATRKHLLVAAGLAVDDGQFLVEVGSSTGLLAQVPRALHCDPPAKGTRTYTTVLLTGATGFIGTHLLHLMLNRTSWQIHCLVRELPGKSARQRLREAYTWYFPDHDFECYARRITVHAADLAEPAFGLADEEHAMLATKVEAVYHLASDTRLYGNRASFDRLNTDPVKHMIRFATTGHIKDLHYMSTLAVCGTGPEGERAVFSENSLNIGQRFLNEYERSKHDAERLILDFASDGGTAFIYRSGNVTGHSSSGRFQRNAGDNRLVQILWACVYLGLTPRVGDEMLSLSPVDIVAEGVFEISRNTRLQGGTFHVDTPYQVSYEEIFAVLRELGCKIADDPARDFSTMFARFLRGGDEQVALAHFWASRPERNVHYDHTRTLRLLGDLGVRFAPPGRSWLRAYITGLIKQGHIAPASDK